MRESKSASIGYNFGACFELDYVLFNLWAPSGKTKKGLNLLMAAFSINLLLQSWLHYSECCGNCFIRVTDCSIRVSQSLLCFDLFSIVDQVKLSIFVKRQGNTKGKQPANVLPTQITYTHNENKFTVKQRDT